MISWLTSLAQFGYGLSLAGASTLLANLWIVYIAARALGDMLVRRWPATRVVLAGCLIAAIGTVLLCPDSMAIAYLGAVDFAIGIAPLIPVYQGWALSRTPERQHGSMNAALGVGAAVVTTLMVWLTGLAIDLNTRLPFGVAVALLLGVVVWAWRTLASGQTPVGGGVSRLG